jgi:hypothetical protein
MVSAQIYCMPNTGWQRLLVHWKEGPVDLANNKQDNFLNLYADSRVEFALTTRNIEIFCSKEGLYEKVKNLPRSINVGHQISSLSRDPVPIYFRLKRLGYEVFFLIHA